MRTKIGAAALSAALFVLAAGCQPTPEESAVTSKNDGALEAALEAEPIQEAGTAGQTEAFSYASSFANSDGSLTFTVDIEDAMLPAGAAPVYQATPHSITAEEAKAVAAAVFGDTEVYEYSTEKTRAELEKTILEKKKHISDWDALVEYYGGDEELAQSVKEEFESSIAYLEELYADAADEAEPQLCLWTFFPDSHYTDPRMVTADMEDYGQELKATATLDGLPYVLTVFNRDESDYTVHYLSLCIDDLLVSQEEQYSAELPSDEDIEGYEALARGVMEALGLDEWQPGEAETSSWERDDGQTNTVTTITVAPVYDGLPILTGGTGGSLFTQSEETSYASRYGDTSLTLRFSGGRLLSCWYEDPVEVTDTVSESAALLSPDELMEKFETQMALQLVTEDDAGTVRVEFTADDLAFGFARTRIKNNASDFYLMPAYAVYGRYVGYNADGVPTCMYDSEESETAMAILFINAVDGSVINTELGY